MIAFIDDHREVHGVEPICKVLPIAPSTYYAYAAKRADPEKLSARARRDMALKPQIARVFVENFEVYGVRKVWRQLQRENFAVARSTVERLMRGMGLQGVIRGRPVRTTISDKRRRVRWTTSIASFTRRARMRCGSRILPKSRPGPVLSMSPSSSTSMRGASSAGGPHGPRMRALFSMRSSRLSKYLSIKYTERLSEAGIEPSVGSVGDSYDNALAETINGLYKAEVIHRRGPWRTMEAVEFATLEWVDWFNNRRLLEPIGNIPPAEAEERYYAMMAETAVAA
jgi:putative transposase